VTYNTRHLLSDAVAHYACIGDAVLTLYSRRKILKEDGVLDGPKSARMTSSEFMGSIGEPARVEAEIGMAFERGGLSAADMDRTKSVASV
jgi:hypothetical protein